MQYSAILTVLFATSITAATLPRQAQALGDVPILGDDSNSESANHHDDGPQLIGDVPILGSDSNTEDAGRFFARQLGSATDNIPILGSLLGGSSDNADDTSNDSEAPDAANSTMLTTGEAAAKCGNNQKLSCCNLGDESSDKSILGNLGGNIVGGNCNQIPINIIGANGILQQACQSQMAACCTGDDGVSISRRCSEVIANQFAGWSLCQRPLQPDLCLRTLVMLAEILAKKYRKSEGEIAIGLLLDLRCSKGTCLEKGVYNITT